MQQYNSFGMRDLFQNPALSSIFPQYNQNEKLQNVYSFAEVEKRVQKYLAGALNGTVTADGELTVNGQHKTVLRQVSQMVPLIESFFNNTPRIAAGIRRNTQIYLPYATRKQMEDIKTTSGKIRAMKAVMDNFQYNSDLGALNSVRNETPERFSRNKKAWETRVGYRRLKKI